MPFFPSARSYVLSSRWQRRCPYFETRSDFFGSMVFGSDHKQARIRNLSKKIYAFLLPKSLCWYFVSLSFPELVWFCYFSRWPRVSVDFKLCFVLRVFFTLQKTIHFDFLSTLNFGFFYLVPSLCESSQVETLNLSHLFDFGFIILVQKLYVPTTVILVNIQLWFAKFANCTFLKILFFL